ncbi:hypothetical protein CGRA01v4_05928 [Colletotrichum graminicola]|uniref:Sulfotransferase domain-containing protein n=1 Tax=Colletotrichum graminicola (strain M1.001 / M2 / FGSC 10212) TaxID=645133 RepID=E3QNK8_COLGM|nr:uncharacterized protein GLRG_07765 [Colletotrichum graminicola M1.001]EFQ32495.1 hypothetical protein GLRG_07765 [Colletotrichum graminicola M1.001]WDK14647.1 hypothetical protein CGRA01v4_05928 [Colletotrichum graminicola]
MSVANTKQPPGVIVRFFVACPRSGSTLLMRVFAESPECGVTSRLMLMDKPGPGVQYAPNHSIFQYPDQHPIYQQAIDARKRFLVSKEELGNDTTKGECLYDLLPSASAYDMARSIFLIRNPVRVFDSWKSLGWTDLQSLIDCYNNLFSMLDRSASTNISCLLYERLVYDPHKEVGRICARWGIPFSDARLKFTKPFGSFLFKSEREELIYVKDGPVGIFKTVESNSSIVQDAPYHGLLTRDEKEQIERTLCRPYLGCWKDKEDQLRATLSERVWFGFDLDDTLHEFRLASSAATDRSLEVISQKYGTPLHVLKKEYSEILRIKTSNAFADGKTSFDYRSERFTLLFECISQTLGATFLAHLLETYETT